MRGEKDDPLTKVGIVVIGRNEGERLSRSLKSVLQNGSPVIYIDSGSRDSSVEIAEALGAQTEVLDPARPFSAARARNAGFGYLTRKHPHLEFIQFVDGDCEVAAGWVEAAVKFLAGHSEVGVVCGRLSEIDARRSIYKRLCAMEWKGPVGSIKKTGGNTLVRVRAYQASGGFDERLFAGEEAELCARVRRAGWCICRISHEMAVHDADIKSLGQWWRRSVRSGYAYVVGLGFRLRRPRHNVREAASIIAWGGALPLLSLVLAWPTNGLSLLFLGLYGLLWCRIAWSRLKQDDTTADAALYATFCVIAKFAQLIGIVRYLHSRSTGSSPGFAECEAGRQEFR